MPWDQVRMSDTAGSLREGTIRMQRSSETMARSRANTGGSGNMHMRNDSGTSGGNIGSSGDYGDQANVVSARKHDYDVQSMETSLGSPASMIRNPIPPPSVTVRSEFPTLSRSRQQQSLTCLITVEVPEGKWRPAFEDLHPMPSITRTTSDFGPVKSPPPLHRRQNSSYESRQQLEVVTEDLHNRVDNWHGLDFSRFGKLRLHGHIRVGKDRRSWQDLDCYLFSEMLICVKERKQPPTQFDGPSEQKRPKCTLKGSILIKKHLKEVETLSGKLSLLTFHLCF